MKENSKIANAIIWRSKDSNKSQNGVTKTTMSGLKIKKHELSNTFWKSLLDILPEFKRSTECTLNISDDGTVLSTDLNPDDAWIYYINYVAHQLGLK